MEAKCGGAKLWPGTFCGGLKANTMSAGMYGKSRRVENEAATLFDNEPPSLVASLPPMSANIRDRPSSRNIPPTTSSSPDSVDVTARNRLVFRRYEKSFKDINDPSFREHAEKFNQWLQNERGYYEAARPEILKLLMIMHNTLRRAVGVAETLHVPFPPQAHTHHPMSEPYAKLVKTVHRHAHVFIEANLQVLLRGLFFSVGLPFTPNTKFGGPIASTSSTVHPNHAAVVPLQYHVPNIASAVPPQPTLPLLPSQTTTPTTRPHASTQGPPSSISANSNAAQGSSTAHTNRAALLSAFSNPVKRELDEPNDFPQSTDGSSRVKIKKRKRKTLDIATLQEFDVQNYLQRIEQTQPQITTGTNALSGSLFAGPSALSVQASTSLHSTSSASPKGGEEVHAVLNVSTPPREVIEILDSPSPEPPEPPSLPATAAVTVKSEPQDDIVLTEVSFHKSYRLDDDSVVVDLSSDIGTEVKETEPIIIAEEARVSASDGAGEVAMDVDSLPAAAETHIIEAQPNRTPLPTHPCSATLTVPLASSISKETTNSDYGEASMDIDSESNLSIASPEGRGPTRSATPVPLPKEISIVGQTSVEALSGSKAEVRTATNEDGVFMSTVDETSIVNEVLVPAVPLPMTDDTIYGDEIKVVALHRGLTYKSCIQFTFDLSEEYFNAIATWSKQEASILELAHSLCISLSCYPLSQVDFSKPLSPQLTSIVSSWPGEGGLSMKMAYKSNIEHFSLSPPLMISPDCTVDLSMFIQPGSNTFQVIQRRNWSEHVFILLAHHPTKSQIQKVEEKREKDELWQGWLKQMAMPLHVQEFPLADTLATIGGATAL